MTLHVPVTTFAADRTDARPSAMDVAVGDAVDRAGIEPM